MVQASRLHVKTQASRLHVKTQASRLHTPDAGGTPAPQWRHTSQIWIACAQRLQRVGPLGDELLGHEALVAGLDDGLHDGRVVDLLRLVDLVAARHAAGVEVGDVLDVLLDRGDQVAFHDLHVVDVVEQLEPLGADLLAHLDAPGRVVALVVLVVRPCC